MTDTEPKLPLPNPADWTDAGGAAAILGRSRPAVYDMVDRGVIAKYRIGTHTMYWVPQVEQVAAAIRKLARRGR
jgi:hypothetical protein